MNNDYLGYVAESKYLGEKWLGPSNNEVGVEGGGEGWQKNQAEAGKYSGLTPNIKFQLKWNVLLAFGLLNLSV